MWCASAATVLILHGRHDAIIPFNMSEALEQAAKGPATRVPIESDHNDLFEEGGEEMFGRIGDFLNSLR